MEISKKNALCGKSFQPEEMGFFWSPTNPPLTIAQRIICLTCQTSDLWHFHMKWSYLWFRITPVRHLRLENNKKKWHLEFLFYFALICGIHELVEPKKVIFSLIKFLRDCMRGFIFLFYLTKPTKHSQKKLFHFDLSVLPSRLGLVNEQLIIPFPLHDHWHCIYFPLRKSSHWEHSQLHKFSWIMY